MANENNKKIPCGGFYLGDGLTMDGNTLKSLGGEQVQTDWNQNDTTAKDYIKNRPFYTGDPVETVLVEESTVDFAAQGGMYSALWPDSSANFEAVEGKTYKVYFDGVPYICVAKLIDSLLFIGNPKIFGADEDTGEPFIIFKNGLGWNIATTDTSPSHVLSISGMVNEIKQIDEKYLPIATEDSLGISYKQLIQLDMNKTYTQNEIKRIVDNINSGIAIYKTNNNIIVKADYSFFNSENDYVRFYLSNGYQLDAISSADGWSLKGVSALYPTAIYLRHTYSEQTLLFTGDYVGGFTGATGNSFQAIQVSDNAKGIKADYVDVENNLIFKCKNATKYIWINADADGKLIVSKRNPGIAVPTSTTSLFQNGEDSLILASSTEGSSKKFKITVDDTGAIKATEVTDN